MASASPFQAVAGLRQVGETLGELEASAPGYLLVEHSGRYIRATSWATSAISLTCSRAPTASMRAVTCLALTMAAVQRRNLAHTSSQVKGSCGEPLWGWVVMVTR